jgi:hypothetical protein
MQGCFTIQFTPTIPGDLPGSTQEPFFYHAKCDNSPEAFTRQIAPNQPGRRPVLRLKRVQEAKLALHPGSGHKKGRKRPLFAATGSGQASRRSAGFTSLLLHELDNGIDAKMTTGAEILPELQRIEQRLQVKLFNLFHSQA